MSENYLGYQVLRLNDEKLSEFYSGNPPKINLFDNEYLLLQNEEGEIIDKYSYKNGKILPVRFKTFRSEFAGELTPRNPEQEIAVDMLKDSRTTVKLLTGTWGTGKTLLLICAALEALDKNKFEKIVWVRNNVQVKDTDNIGALPGTELDKMLPYVMPFADHCGGIDGVKGMIERGVLEVIPLAFLRGRSIRNSIIISSEAENLTKQHIQLLLGRVDEGSQLWMDADLKQRDRQIFVNSAGLETMIDRLKGNELFGYVHLVKSERSATARLADLLND